MKRMGTIVAGVVLSVLACGLATPNVSAQDPVKVGPEIYTKRFENDRVRVSSIHFKPGASIVMHSHPDHFVYVLTAGTLRLSYPDGTTKEFAGKPNDVVWIPAETHAAVNTGGTDFNAIVVELKPLPND